MRLRVYDKGQCRFITETEAGKVREVLGYIEEMIIDQHNMVVVMDSMTHTNVHYIIRKVPFHANQQLPDKPRRQTGHSGKPVPVLSPRT